MMHTMDEIRLQKVQEMRAAGVIPYAAKFDRSHTCNDARGLQDDDTAAIAGRVMLMREMGKMTFVSLQDHTGRMQVALKQDDLGAETYKEALSLIDRGDFIGIHGTFFTTQKGEPTLLVKEWQMLSKALRQPPEKWHGIADQETAWRQRYLDTMSNQEAFERFNFRNDFIHKLREFYWNHDFTEITTPVLVNSASGALATPFSSHHEAYDMDVYLRIAIETFQKECLVGGFDRTFEIGPVFRNEGLDPSHLQEFTMCEHYAAYWDYEENMRFTEEMLASLTKELTGSTILKIPDRDGNLVEVDFAPPWPRLSIRDAIKNACGIDFMDTETADELRAAMTTNNIKLDVPVDKLGRGNLIDQLYKKVSRPDIVNPTFLIQHPVELSPLARINDENPAITDRFQLVVSGWEIVNAYSELVDPVDQAERFADQAKAHAGGDADAHEKDDEYVKALSYGCPPCSGWGMGIERIVALLTQQMNLREVVYFPLMKPEGKEASASKEAKEVKDPDTSNLNSSSQSSPSSQSSQSLPDEHTKRFIAVLNKKAEPGRLMNALGHMTAGLSDLASQSADLCFLQYEDADGGVHPNISHFPFIVLKADNSNKIRKVREEAMARGIPFTDFTSTMTIGTSQEQQDATKESKEEDLEYLGICLFGSTKELKEFTGKFSLFN